MGQYGAFIWLAVMVLMFYFMILRPQKKKEKEDRKLRNSLTVGDEIVTIGGFTGRVLDVKDDTVVFETGAARTRLTVMKWAIQSRTGAPAAPAAPAAEEKEEKKEDKKDDKKDEKKEEKSK